MVIDSAAIWFNVIYFAIYVLAGIKWIYNWKNPFRRALIGSLILGFILLPGGRVPSANHFDRWPSSLAGSLAFFIMALMSKES